MADIISLSRFKSSLPKISDPDAPDPKDNQYAAAIAAASAMIRSYTGMELCCDLEQRSSYD